MPGALYGVSGHVNGLCMFQQYAACSKMISSLHAPKRSGALTKVRNWFHSRPCMGEKGQDAPNFQRAPQQLQLVCVNTHE